jgi:hypothetical protein
VFNRAAGRARLFREDADYGAFLRVVGETHGRLPVAPRLPRVVPPRG